MVMKDVSERFPVKAESLSNLFRPHRSRVYSLSRYTALPLNGYCFYTTAFYFTQAQLAVMKKKEIMMCLFI